MKIFPPIFLLILAGQLSLASNTDSIITLERLRQVDRVVQQFKLENHRLPSESEGLHAVRGFLNSENALLDAWGRPFAYALTSTNDGCVIYSLGQDGLSATAGNDPDDINLWDADQTWQSHYKAQPIRSNLLVGGFGLSALVLTLVAARRRWQLSQKPR